VEKTHTGANGWEEEELKEEEGRCLAPPLISPTTALFIDRVTTFFNTFY
tara:strand:- start:201 stop:347 length:147 start_codon:yes stop_codon:yes gene_type:complete